MKKSNAIWLSICLVLVVLSWFISGNINKEKGLAEGWKVGTDWCFENFEKCTTTNFCVVINPFDGSKGFEIEHTNKSQEWFYEVAYEEDTVGMKECCYPSDCLQAKDNPQDCDCIYMVKCGSYEELTGNKYNQQKET